MKKKRNFKKLWLKRGLSLLIAGTLLLDSGAGVAAWASSNQQDIKATSGEEATLDSSQDIENPDDQGNSDQNMDLNQNLEDTLDSSGGSEQTSEEEPEGEAEGDKSTETPIEEATIKEEENTAQSVPIDETTFPDEKLRGIIEKQVDVDHDFVLSEEESDQVKSLDLSNGNIYDLTGLQLFTNLEELDCSWNHLKEDAVAPYLGLNKIKYDNNTYLVEDIEKQVEQSRDLTVEEETLTQGDTPVPDTNHETVVESGQISDVMSEEPKQLENSANQIKPWCFTYIAILSSQDFQDLPITEETFPDEHLRTYLSREYDTDEDGTLNFEEQKVITSLNVKDQQIQDLTGIGAFKNLLLLDCSKNQLMTLSTQELTELRGLYCRENQIQQLDITENTKLKQLECDENVVLTGELAAREDLKEAEADTQENAKAVLENETKLAVGKATLKSLSNPSKGVLRVSMGKVSGASGYFVQMSKDKNFKTGIRRFFTTKTTLDVSRCYDEWVYYVRVRAYKLDSAGKKVFGAFSTAKVLRVKNGLILVNPSTKAATLKSVSLASKTTVRVTATVPNVVRSKDNYYYLFNMTTTESKLPPTRKPIAKLTKRTNLTYNVALGYNSTSNRLYYQFAVGVKNTSGKYQLISSMSFISNPEKLATSSRAFPKSSTKKGLQVNEYYISDAVNLGVKHTTYNMCLDDMIATDAKKNNTDGIAFSYAGKTYWFNKGIIQSYDRVLNTYKSDNMIVSAIILMRYRPDLLYMVPNGNYQSGFYALNVSNKQAREQLAATFTFLAKRYAATGLIANWIIGNEVNNYGTYHYSGSSSLAYNAKIYTNAFRVAYIAIRSVYSNARLYISLDHLWNTLTSTGNASRLFLNKFAAYWKSYGNFNIAYHPYPSPLTAPEFWKNTNGACTSSYNSPCVNMSNLHVLTNYVKSKYGSNTRIILSEQGFTSLKGGLTVEKNQAAAIAYAYYIAEFNDMVDAFILHRHVDHQAEINQGLALGLYNRKSGTIETMGTKKYAWDVYKYVDTSKGASKTAFALPIIGKASWKAAVSGYNTSRFQ